MNEIQVCNPCRIVAIVSIQVGFASTALDIPDSVVTFAVVAAVGSMVAGIVKMFFIDEWMHRRRQRERAADGAG